MNWQSTLETLIQHHLDNFKYYRDRATVQTDLSIKSFVVGNIDGMSSVYRLGVIAVLITLATLARLRFFATLPSLSATQRDRFLAQILPHFPFGLLNKLVCGSIFMRLFEVVESEQR